jgi:hypothetical protein
LQLPIKQGRAMKNDVRYSNMPDFKVGEHVRVINRGARYMQLGEIQDVVPNLTNEEQFQAYVVAFETGVGVISEHYLQYELQHSDRQRGARRA